MNQIDEIINRFEKINSIYNALDNDSQKLFVQNLNLEPIQKELNDIESQINNYNLSITKVNNILQEKEKHYLIHKNLFNIYLKLNDCNIDELKKLLSS